MDLKLTKNSGNNHDITFTNGRLDTVDGLEEIGNRVLFNLGVYRGENPFNIEYGVDYLNNVFGRSVDDTVTIDELKSAVLSTRGIINLKEFELEFVSGTRTAQLTIQAQTTQGELDLTTTVNI